MEWHLFKRKTSLPVIPAKAGIHWLVGRKTMDSRFRGNDGTSRFKLPYRRMVTAQSAQVTSRNNGSTAAPAHPY
jgi:hypothetical protein